MPRLSPVVLLVLALAGCELFTAPARTVQRRALIESPTMPAYLLIPDTVVATVPFEVTIVTHGGCDLKGRGNDTLTYGTAEAILALYDRYSAPCPDLVRTYIHHRFTLTFPDAGDATVRIVGRSEGDNAADVFERSRSVVVTPALQTLGSGR